MLTHKIEGVFTPNMKHESLTQPIGGYRFIRRDNTEDGKRYAIKLREGKREEKTVCVNVHGRHAEVEAQLDMVEMAIIHNALFSMAETEWDIKCVDVCDI